MEENIPEWLPESIKERTKSAIKGINEREQQIQMQLPIWNDATRRIPNEIVRSALFKAKNRNTKREYLKDADVVVIGDGQIKYTGEELRQNDEIVWLELIHLARGVPAGQVIEFTPYSFCKAVKWPINNGSYTRLRECLTRMQATSLSVYSKRLQEGISLSMIPQFSWKNESGTPLSRYKVNIAPQLVSLFGDTYFTQIEWEQRLMLSPGIATWLHGYFASHRSPFPVKIETVYSGSGSTSKDMKSFKRQVKTALESLVEVGFIKEFAIDDSSLIHVTRNYKYSG
jgi:hypothetical protein